MTEYQDELHDNTLYIVKVPLLAVLLVILQVSMILGQNKVDFGIFASATPGQFEIRINPNYTENGTQYLTNAQFTIKWPVSSGITSLVSATPVYPFLLNPQGSPVIDNGYYYLTWVTPGGSPISWSANQEIVIQSISYASVPCPAFEIAHDSFTQNVINGDYYIEVNGNPDLTGIIYHTYEGPGPGTPGIISGTDTVYNGMNNISYSVAPVTNASSYSWVYSGTGATINGTGDTVTISFSSSATSGNLTVSGQNTCGNGPSSPPFMITVIDPLSVQPANAGERMTNRISFYPNPAEGSIIYLELACITNKEVEVEILNILSGLKKISRLRINPGSHQSSGVDISNLEGGIYLIKIDIDSQIYIGKFIKI